MGKAYVFAWMDVLMIVISDGLNERWTLWDRLVDLIFWSSSGSAMDSKTILIVDF
jgi:hypothetical protein